MKLKLNYISDNLFGENYRNLDKALIVSAKEYIAERIRQENIQEPIPGKINRDGSFDVSNEFFKIVNCYFEEFKRLLCFNFDKYELVLMFDICTRNLQIDILPKKEVEWKLY